MTINKINVSELIIRSGKKPILWDSRVDGYKMAGWKSAVCAQIVVNLKADKCVCSLLNFVIMSA